MLVFNIKSLKYSCFLQTGIVAENLRLSLFDTFGKKWNFSNRNLIYFEFLSKTEELVSESLLYKLYINVLIVLIRMKLNTNTPVVQNKLH